jgi:hypothetical protein
MMKEAFKCFELHQPLMSIAAVDAGKQPGYTFVPLFKIKNT